MRKCKQCRFFKTKIKIVVGGYYPNTVLCRRRRTFCTALPKIENRGPQDPECSLFKWNDSYIELHSVEDSLSIDFSDDKSILTEKREKLKREIEEFEKEFDLYQG